MLDNGQTVFVDYATDQCSTRARQERIIQASMDVALAAATTS